MKSPHHLPSFMIRLVNRWCETRKAEYILGDVNELLQQRIQEGQRATRVLVWIDFFSLLLHGVLKPSFNINFSNGMILKNYFKVAFRSLVKQRVHSGINIIGLSVGLSISLLITLYVLNELSYDRFHKKADRIYLLPITWHFGGTDLPSAHNCTAGGPLMKESFPQVEEYVRLTGTTRSFYKGTQLIQEDEGLLADSTFFQIFSFPLLIGNPKDVLTAPNSIVLTRTLAEKYLGPDWSGKVADASIESPNGKLLNVTGVMEDVPTNSHLQFQYLVSFSSLPNAKNPDWNNSNYRTYLLLNQNANVAEIKEKMPLALDEKYGKGTSETVELDLMPLIDLYLYNQNYSMPDTSDILYTRVFAIIALLVMSIAIVNYINLATSRSLERSLEVGVRKVMGAFQQQLFSQFMIESFITTSIAFVLALGLARTSLPMFNAITGKTLELHAFLNTKTILLLIGLGAAISIIAGIYPALVISRYQPMRVLKGKFTHSLSGIRLRKSLVVIQFGISIILIICTLTVSSQLNYVRTKELGINKEKLVAISLDSAAKTRIKPLKNILNGESKIRSTCASSQIPIRIQWEIKINEKNGPDENSRLITVWGTDKDFMKTTGVKLIAGNGFMTETPENEWQVILNEKALEFFGWNVNEALGKEVNFWQSNGTVQGVVQDFHFSSLHNEIKPLIIFTGNANFFYRFLIVNSVASAVDTHSVLEKHWKTINPDAPFVMHFVDESFDRMYDKENRMANIVNIFSVLAILISGLGLFGLASYSIVQRTKELGIRKVLGATIGNLIVLVSKDFLILIVIALLLATPLSYYFMQEWLARFAYKVNFSWMLVAGAGIIAVLIAGFTVSYHSFQVAKNNPVNSLRNE